MYYARNFVLLIIIYTRNGPMRREKRDYGGVLIAVNKKIYVANYVLGVVGIK